MKWEEDDTMMNAAAKQPLIQDDDDGIEGADELYSAIEGDEPDTNRPVVTQAMEDEVLKKHPELADPDRAKALAREVKLMAHKVWIMEQPKLLLGAIKFPPKPMRTTREPHWDGEKIVQQEVREPERGSFSGQVMNERNWFVHVLSHKSGIPIMDAPTIKPAHYVTQLATSPNDRTFSTKIYPQRFFRDEERVPGDFTGEFRPSLAIKGLHVKLYWIWIGKRWEKRMEVKIGRKAPNTQNVCPIEAVYAVADGRDPKPHMKQEDRRHDPKNKAWKLVRDYAKVHGNINSDIIKQVEAILTGRDDADRIIDSIVRTYDTSPTAMMEDDEEVM